MYRLFPLLFLLSAAVPSAPGPLPFPVETVRSGEVAWTVAEIPLADLQLLGQAPGDPHRFRDLPAFLSARNLRPLLAMNAGIFESSTEPTGLFVEDGVVRHPLNLSSGEGNFFWAPNGVFWVDAQGAHIAPSSAYKPASAVRLATQSGPLLLRDGKVHPGAARSTSKHVRNGVGIRDDGTVLFAISTEPVTFPETIALFQGLRCDDALYLDGTISELCLGEACARDSAMWAGMLVVTAPR